MRSPATWWAVSPAAKLAAQNATRSAQPAKKAGELVKFDACSASSSNLPRSSWAGCFVLTRGDVPAAACGGPRPPGRHGTAVRWRPGLAAPIQAGGERRGGGDAKGGGWGGALVGWQTTPRTGGGPKWSGNPWAHTAPAPPPRAARAIL